MGFRNALLNLGQIRLIAYNVFAACMVVGLMLLLFWLQYEDVAPRKVLSGYIDKAAYVECSNKAWSIERASEEDMIESIVAETECEERWGVWKLEGGGKKTFLSFVTEVRVDVALGVLIVSAVLYFLAVVYRIYACFDNPGWKRLSLVLYLYPCRSLCSFNIDSQGLQGG